MSEQLWWYVARASGITAWLMVAASVLWGMALSTRALGRRPAAPWLTDLHRFLGALAVAFTGVHLVALWADSYVELGPIDLFVPLATSYRPAPVALGVVALYLLVAVELTSLMMRRLPRRWWKRIHLGSYALYALATAHLLALGTDATNPVLRWVVWASVGAVGFFTTYLVVGPGRRASTRARPAAPERAAAPAASRTARDDRAVLEDATG